MNIKQYLKLIDPKFIISTEHLFISYHEWESTIINLKTKQHFKNLNTLIDKYPLSHQLNIPITDTSHHIILEKPNITTNHISYEEWVSVDTKTKLTYTIGKDKYSLEINPHTLAHLPYAEPTKHFTVEMLPLRPQTRAQTLLNNFTQNLNNRIYDTLRIPQDQLLNNVHLSHDGMYSITYPETDHREIWDLQIG